MAAPILHEGPGLRGRIVADVQCAVGRRRILRLDAVRRGAGRIEREVVRRGVHAARADIDIAEIDEALAPVQLHLQHAAGLEGEAAVVVDELRLDAVAVECDHLGRSQRTVQQQHVVALVVVEVANHGVIDVGGRRQHRGDIAPRPARHVPGLRKRPAGVDAHELLLAVAVHVDEYRELVVVAGKTGAALAIDEDAACLLVERRGVESQQRRFEQPVVIGIEPDRHASALVGVAGKPVLRGAVKQLAALVDHELDIAADAGRNDEVLVAVIVEIHPRGAVRILDRTGAGPVMFWIERVDGIGVDAAAVVQVDGVLARVIVQEQIRMAVAIHVAPGRAVGNTLRGNSRRSRHIGERDLRAGLGCHADQRGNNGDWSQAPPADAGSETASHGAPAAGFT